MLAFKFSEEASLVRYRSVGKDEGFCCIESLLEAPIKQLSSNGWLQNGSYVISNRGMEWMPIYQENNSTHCSRQSHYAGLPSLPVSTATCRQSRLYVDPISNPHPQYEVLLRILSYLDVRSLGMLSQTCRRMAKVTGDELLWQQRLKWDSHQWQMVGHLSHPEVYQMISKEMTSRNM